MVLRRYDCAGVQVTLRDAGRYVTGNRSDTGNNHNRICALLQRLCIHREPDQSISASRTIHFTFYRVVASDFAAAFAATTPT